MKLTTALLAVLFLIPSVSAKCECNQHDAKSTDGLVSAENRWVKALDQRDQKALSCLLAPEFKDAGVYGELRDREKVLADLPHRLDAGQRLDNLETLLFGFTGVVRGVNHLTTTKGQPMVDVRFTDVFVYRRNRWLAISAQETLVHPPEQKK